MTNLRACQSFRRLVSPMTGILGIKKSASWSKRKQTVSSNASPTQQTPSKSSICALYLAILIQKIGILSVHYRTKRRMTPFLNTIKYIFVFKEGLNHGSWFRLKNAVLDRRANIRSFQDGPGSTFLSHPLTLHPAYLIRHS